MAGGTRYEKEVSFVKGSPQNPFNMSEIEAKFMRLSSPVIGNRNAERFLNNIDTYDENLNIREVISDLQPE
jgi:2-methylcitrate dehydratase PrpD